jgi:hypothetical protein
MERGKRLMTKPIVTLELDLDRIMPLGPEDGPMAVNGPCTVYVVRGTIEYDGMGGVRSEETVTTISVQAPHLVLEAQRP